MFRGIGTTEEELKLCATERANQSALHSQCKTKTVPLLYIGIAVVGIIGYLVGKSRSPKEDADYMAYLQREDDD